MNEILKFHLKENWKGDEPERITLDFGRANNCLWISSSHCNRMLRRRSPNET